MTQPSPLSRSFTAEFQLAALPRSLAAGALAFLLEVIMAVSFTTLIFSGPLAPALPYGIGLLVAGDAVVCVVVALLSSYAGSIPVAQDVPSAVLAAAVVSLLATLPTTVSPAQQFSTVIVTIAGTTLLTGALFTVLGALKLGGLVRFLPYPVVGGFLAGTGYLLTRGGIGVMLKAGLNLQMLRPDQWLHWAPGLMLGALMLLAKERFKSPLAVPGAFVAGLLIFYSAAWLTGTTVWQLSSGGWLLGPFPAGSVWQFPLSPAVLSQVNWTALLGQWPHLAAVAMVSVVALLLNANGIELIVKRDIDLNHELATAGIANLAGGLVGGTVGYHAISLSSLSHSIAGGKRLPGLLVAILMCTVAVVGPTLFGYFPRLVLGALLVFLGLDLLFQWVYRAWFRFPRIDFLIVATILIIIALRGFLEGVGVGLVLAIILFVVSYSRIPLARYAVSGRTYRSRVLRRPREQEILDVHGDMVYVLKLQGFVFFGTADRLLEQIRERSHNDRLASLRFVVLDMAEVTGLDSTASLSFEKLLRLAREEGITIVLAGLSSRTLRQFTGAAVDAVPDELRSFADIDHAVEWCEDQIIAAQQTDLAPEITLRDDLGAILPENMGLQRLIANLERTQLEAGEYLVRQGDVADALYFIESGQVTTQLEADGRPPLRLETSGGGRSIGEIAFYLGIPRTATVVADQTSVIWRLSRQRLAQLEETDPEAAYALHRIIVHLLGQRVQRLTLMVDALGR